MTPFESATFDDQWDFPSENSRWLHVISNIALEGTGSESWWHLNGAYFSGIQGASCIAIAALT